MNKLRSILALFLLTSLLGLTWISGVVAAPTRFTSPNFELESVIFGGTGVLRSTEASIPPVITAGPLASAITAQSATISWTTSKPSNSVVLLGTTSGTYPNESGQLTDTTFFEHEVNLTSLKKGTVYYYKVRSSDVAGNIVQSSENTFTTDAGDVTAPTLTNGPTLSNNSSSSVTISWETNELSNSIIEYGTSSVSQNSAGQAEESTLFHQVEVTGLLPSQKYFYRLKNTDSSDNTFTSATLDFTTISAPSITEVKISDITLNSAVVQWKTTLPSNSVVKYGPAKLFNLATEDLETYSENHLIRLTGLESGTIYTLQINAEDKAGNKLISDEYVFQTVVLPTISEFKVSEIKSDSALLTWVSSAEIDELIRYEITGSSDKKLIGKKESAGNDTLLTNHTYLMSDLESGSDYQVSVVGKDVFGNQALSTALSFKTLPDSDPPLIENIKSDTTVDLGSKQTVQVLVSFGLSELGTASIEYGDGATGSYTKKIENDTELSRSKFMVIPGLRPGESYHFHIVAKDRAGNVATSADYLVLAPSQQVSLLDLIFGEVRRNLGWLTNLTSR